MLATASASRPRTRPGPKWDVISNVAFSGSLLVDVYKQARVGCPALITLFPGAWQVGSKNDATMTTTAVSFAALGYCVFNGSYTLSGAQEDLDPQIPITDVLTLVSWVRANAATYNANPTKVAVLGKSAGGHLALMAGIQGVAGGSRPDAVIGWSPPCELGTLTGSGGSVAAPAYMNCAYIGNEALWRSFSPTNSINSNCCPIRVVGSTTEPAGGGIAQFQFDGLYDAALAAGVTASKRIFSSTIHAEFDGIVQANGSTPSTKDTNESDAWLKSVGIS